MSNTPVGILVSCSFPMSSPITRSTRLRRAEGQVRGVIRLLEEGADCKDVVTQLSAAQSALHRAGIQLMASGMRHCLTSPDSSDADADAIEALFLNIR